MAMRLPMTLCRITLPVLSADDIVSNHLAGFVPGPDGLAYLGKTGFQLLICLVFIGQTAHQPTALAGNFGWIQRQTLLLGHFDGNRLKFIDECRTAYLTATAPETTAHLRLVSDTNLAHFNSGPELLDKTLHQFAKIYAAVRCKKKRETARIEGTFNGKEVHLESVFSDAVHTKDICALFQAYIGVSLPVIFFIGNSIDLFQRPAGPWRILQQRRYRNKTEAESLFRFNDHLVAFVQDKGATVKMIYFSSRFKSDAYNFFHDRIP